MRTTIAAMAAFSGALAAAPVPVHAQGAAHLQEIVVTARRREEAIQSVPVAVTAIAGADLGKMSVVNTDDLMRNVPSLTFGIGTRSGSVPFYGIRGVNSFDVVGALDPAVGIYMNEVVQQRANGVSQALYDIDSVQVLKGPQGTLFGRNTTGGAILISSRKPGREFGGYLDARAGDYGYGDVEGAVNVPLAPWAQARVAGKWVTRDGYVHARTTGQDQSDLGSYGVRASLALQPTDSIETTTVYSLFRQQTNGTGGVTPGLFPGNVFSGNAVVNPTTRNVADAGNRAAIAAAGALGAQDFYLSDSNELLEDDVRTWDITNVTTLNWNDELSFKNIVGYRRIHAGSVADADGAFARQLTVITKNSFEQISEEFQVLWNRGPWEALAGIYWFRESGTDEAFSFTSIPLARIGNPAAQGVTGAEITNESISGFAHVTYAFSDRIKGSAGVRVTHDDRTITLGSRNISNPFTNPVSVCSIGQTISNVAGAGPLGENVITTAVANPCALTKEIGFDEATWSLSIDYKFDDDTLLYIAHHKGYRSGAFNQRATFEIPDDFAQPEFLYDVEAGIKTDFEGEYFRGRFNLAGYYGWYDDIQRTISLSAVILNGVRRIPASLGNAASGNISGLEAELTLLPSDALEITAFYSYNQAEYEEWTDNSVTPALDRSTAAFPYAPMHTGGVTARYTIPEVLGGDLVLQGNYYGRSKTETTSATNYPVYASLDPYNLFNLRVELNQPFGQPMNLGLFVNNVFDEEYHVGGAPVPAVGTAVLFPGPPRMFGVQLKYTFGGDVK
ncbi:MAG: TonB-dependent receptor [Gammaproteobacteria bacterium]